MKIEANWTEADMAQAEEMAAEHNDRQRKSGPFVSPWVDHPRMPEAEALAELRAAGVPARPWQGYHREIYLNDGTNCSIAVDRAGTVRELDVWHAIWCWVTGRKMWRDATCPTCGDGVERGHALCTACEKKVAEPKPRSARTDNWTASMRMPQARNDNSMVRCFMCRGRKGKTQYGTPCKTCGGKGWVYHRKATP